MADYIDYQTKLKRIYPHIADEVIDDIIMCAREILIHLLYPSQLKVQECKKHDAYDSYAYWIYRCCKEMIGRLGMESAITYQENRLSISFDSSQISRQLINEIVPVMELI